MSAPPPPCSIPRPSPVGRREARRLIASNLATVRGLIHAFTLRGSESRAVLSDLGGADLPIRTLRQVHGSAVRVASGDPMASGAALDAGDALITDRRGIAIAIRIADCVPILICHERSGAIAAVHAGWRGTVAGVLPAAIRSLHETFGAGPRGMRIALGPCIGPCCFEVGMEVVEALESSGREMHRCVHAGTRPRVDLIAANRLQAVAAGVPGEAIETIAACTVCHSDLFESHRRDGERAGRMLGVIAWAP